MSNSDYSCLIIADGAAFGPEMERMEEMIHAGYKISLYLPESFEWIVLLSGIVKDSETKKILDTPGEYIESSTYFSWERFFTALLIARTRGTHYQYQKSTLNKVYLHEKEKRSILAVLPEQIRDFFEKEV